MPLITPEQNNDRRDFLDNAAAAINRLNQIIQNPLDTNAIRDMAVILKRVVAHAVRQARGD